MNNRARRVRNKWSSQPSLELRSVYILTACFLGAVGLGVGFAVTGTLKASRPEYRHVYHNASEIPSKLILELDTIVVLGGGAPLSIDEPPVYVQRRCDDAAEVVRLRTEFLEKNSNRVIHKNLQALPILTLSAGTAHVPQLMSANGLPIWESTASAAYLNKKHGIAYDTMFVETASYDTIGNAYYTRTAHTDINGWRSLLIVTNKVCHHVPRKVLKLQYVSSSAVLFAVFFLIYSSIWHVRRLSLTGYFMSMQPDITYSIWSHRMWGCRLSHWRQESRKRPKV